MLICIIVIIIVEVLKQSSKIRSYQMQAQGQCSLFGNNEGSSVEYCIYFEAVA